MSDLDGITDETVTLTVSAGQYAQLERDLIKPGRPRVTHKISVGPFSLPGTWVVTGAQRRHEGVHRVILAKLED
jgi:hypothetical protein